MTDGLLAIAKEQGRVSGVLAGVETTVKDLKDDQRRIWERLDTQNTAIKDVGSDVKGLNGKLDQFIKALQETGSHPSLPAIPPEPPSIVLTVLRHPATPLAFALVVVLIIVILLVSALTGRAARDMLPTPGSSQVKQ